MKRLLFIALAIMPMLIEAQAGFEPQIKVSYELGIDDDKNQSFGGEFLAGYRFNNNLRLGVGTGIYWCKHLYESAHYNSVINYYSKEYRETASYIPIYANGKFNFETSGNLKPYLSLDLGYALFNAASDYAKENELGLFAKPAFGIDIATGKGSLFFEVGYKYQYRKFYDEKMGYSQLTMSVGYNF